MTAEIAIMNRIGVALAADSAVTLGGAENKIYTSADKLFLLSEGSPVGVMVYGNANILDVPWETAIKIYRKQLGYKTFPTVADHAQDFINYLQHERNLFSEKTQESYVTTIATSFFHYIIHEKFTEEFNKERTRRLELEDESLDPQLSESDIEIILEEILDDEIVHLRKQELYKDLPEDFVTQLETKYAEVILSAKNNIFGNFPSNQLINSKSINAIAEFLSREIPSVLYTGVVITGFGDTEHFPSLSVYEIDGIACDRLLFRLVNNVTVGGDDSPNAIIMPFAQQEMVYTFMEGIDPDLKGLFEQSVLTLFRGVSESLLEEIMREEMELSNDFEERTLNKLKDLLGQLFTRWDGARLSNNTLPILEIAASLPKDELASMAESLVNLTKFKRRVSRQQETVGGPIDVAVITKGDGFVWIKKKYYFRGELNPRFLSKYYNLE